MAAVPRSGTPEKSAAPSRPVRERPPGAPAVMRRRLLATVAAAAVAVLLFVAYVQVSRTYAVNSDSANILLMSWDMLHGNLLLHGWYLSDVSFYPTELPQYAMLEGLLGLHADTAHIAAAMTYTLAVIFAVLLARGPRDRAPGRAAHADLAGHRLGRDQAVLARGVDCSPPRGGSTPPDPPGRPPREGMVRSGHCRATADLGPGRRSARARGGDRPPRRGLRHTRPARRLVRAPAGARRGPAGQLVRGVPGRRGDPGLWPGRPGEPAAVGQRRVHPAPAWLPAGPGAHLA